MKIVGCDLHTRYQAGGPGERTSFYFEGAPSKLCLGGGFRQCLPVVRPEETWWQTEHFLDNQDAEADPDPLACRNFVQACQRVRISAHQ